MACILGISGLYHDSAACLLMDGRLIAAAQEERFTRLKHDASLPVNAIDYCLEAGGISPGELDYVVFYEKPLLKFDRLLETYLAYTPRGFFSFFRAMPSWLKKKLHIPREIRRAVGKEYSKAVAFTGHHEAHAASAFFPSPFESAAVLTIDGVGEWETAVIWSGEGNRLRPVVKLDFPHSLGLLYTAFTYHAGFRVNSGEYKLMGLAPYGEPVYAEKILDRLVDLKPDGSFAMNMEFFGYCQGLTMTNRKFNTLFDGPPRQPESPITQREMNLAASIQAVTEKIMLRLANTAREMTGHSRLCMAGGVALNCVANGKILKREIFDDIWIQPAAGDAGGALGAALAMHHLVLGEERHPVPGDSMEGALLGPSFSNEAVRQALESSGIPYQDCDEESLLKHTVEILDSGGVVGWFQGRMEFGPRALGARSILGDPRNPGMQSRMNLKIKFRESFRPFAPSVRAEDASHYFKLDRSSPYMLLVAEVRDFIPKPPTMGKASEREKGRFAPDLCAWINEPRSNLPAVTHIDGSARVQTVDERNGRFRRLMNSWKAFTGCSVLINTSFNIRGEPIVCTPQDAVRCFLATDMDALVIEDCLVQKTGNMRLSDEAREKHLSAFALD